MPIRNLLKIIVSVILLTFASGSAVIYRSFRDYQTELHQASAVNEISFHVFQRRLVADDYLLNQSQRAKDQWYIEQNKTEKLLSDNKADFQIPEEKTLFKTLVASIEDSKQNFETILQLYENHTGSADKTAIYASRLSVKTQETVSIAETLEQVNTAAANRSLDKVIWLFSAVTGLFLIMLLASFWMVWQSTRRLERQEAEAEATLSSIGDGVFAIDPSGKIFLFNPIAEQLSGYTRAEALSKPYDEIFRFSREHTGELVDDFIKTALSGKKAEMSNHTVLERKDGSILPVADSAAPILSTNGSIEGVVVVFRDVSHDREVERLKDEFVSIASHELRTPMGAIRGFVSMILSGTYGPLNKNLIEPLNDVKTGTLRLISLVNELLDISRIEAGRMKFTLTNFEVSDVLDSVVTSLEPLGKEHNLKLQVTNTTRTSVQADNNKLQQVLTNLIGNSLKFTASGTITVSMEVDNDMVEVTVTDTGTGIAQEDQNRLFGKFQQIASPLAGRPAGSGLGLYVSREIIRKMGGELWLKSSAPGKGSVFSFTLTRSDTDSAAKIKAAINREEKLNPNQK